MGRPVSDIVRDLQLVDLGDPYLRRLKELCDELASCDEPASAVEPVLRFMEANRHRELGMPGPLVHFLEKVPGYEEALIRSLERAPTQHTVWMLNRMINAADEEHEAPLLELMRTIASTEEDSDVRQDAIEFLEFQEGAKPS